MDSKNTQLELNQLSTVETGGDKTLVAAQDVDEALRFLSDNLDVGQTTQIDDKKLMRRVDWMLMPLMFACYYLQYTDKTLLSYSGIMGIIDDTHMPSNGFSHLAIAFYVSFLVCEPMQSYMLQRFPTAKWLGANVVCWGVVLALNCVCHNFASLVALRVLLGAFESVTAPSLVILTSMWTSGLSLIAYGFGHWTASDPGLSFKSWQILFLLFGCITVIVGVLVLLFLPDNPFKSRLKPDEKLYIIERVRANQTGIENKRFKWLQFKEVVTDIRTWLLSLIVILTNVPNGAVSSFSSIIIENFGYDEYQSLLLNLPGSAVAFVSVWLGAFWAGRFNGRGVAIITLIIPTLMGGALMAWLPADNKPGLLAGVFLINTVGANAGHTKKISMNAILLMSFCVGNIIGPETFQDKDAPQYIPAKITIVVTLAVAMIITVILGLLYAWDNKNRDREGQPGPGDLPPNYEFMDLTDKQNRNFRYLL